MPTDHDRNHYQVDDPTCISRLTAFSDDAERLIVSLVPTHILKISNFRFMAIEKKFKGQCTCPLEFRADKQTVITLGDLISGEVSHVSPPF